MNSSHDADHEGWELPQLLYQHRDGLCRYFMAFEPLDHGSGLLIAFPKTLPKLNLLQPVYREVYRLITTSPTSTNIKCDSSRQS